MLRGHNHRDRSASVGEFVYLYLHSPLLITCDHIIHHK